MSLWKKFVGGFKSGSTTEQAEQFFSQTHEDTAVTKKNDDEIILSGEQNYKKGIDYFRLSSDGRGQDLNKAMQYFSKASDQNHPMSNMYLAIMFLRGIGFNIDRAKGLMYLKKAEALNVDESYLYLADYYKEISFKLSLKYFEKYFETRLFEKDGNTELINQNSYYSKIESVKKYCDLLIENNKSINKYIINSFKKELIASHEKDYNFYLECASEDYDYSSEKLHCIKVMKNIDEKYILQQDNENNFSSRKNIDDDFLDNLTLSKNENPWDDAFEQAETYYYGLGDDIQDYKEALKYYKIAADLGSDEAKFKLGVMYVDGEGCKKNNEKALEYFKLGVNSGNLNCYAEMANLFRETEHIQNASKCWDKFFLSDDNYGKRDIAGHSISYLTAVRFSGVEFKYKNKLSPYKNEIIKRLERMKESLLRDGNQELADSINFYYSYLS